MPISCMLNEALSSTISLLHRLKVYYVQVHKIENAHFKITLIHFFLTKTQCLNLVKGAVNVQLPFLVAQYWVNYKKICSTYT